MGSDVNSISSFLVELWSEDGTKLGYQDIDSSLVGSAIFNGTSQTGASPYVIEGGFTAVPEPTSGILLMFGLAALALRRPEGHAPYPNS